MRDSFIFHLYTNIKSIFIQQILSGSSFVSPALGGVGQGRLNINDNFPPKKILTKSKQAGKKKKGCGENEFLPCGVGAFPQFLRQQKGKTEKFSFP